MFRLFLFIVLLLSPHFLIRVMDKFTATKKPNDYLVVTILDGLERGQNNQQRLCLLYA